MLDTLTAPRDEDDFNTVAGCRPDPGGFLPEARTGAREAAGHMKNLAERFAELRNAIMRLPGNPSCDWPAPNVCANRYVSPGTVIGKG